MASDCSKAFADAIKRGEMTEEEAENLIDAMRQNAKRRAAERNIQVTEALKQIAGEMEKNDNLSRAVDRRNRLLTIRAIRRAVAESSKDGKMADNLRQYMENAYQNALVLGHRLTKKLERRLEADGVLEEFRKGLHGEDVFLESWELSLGDKGKPGITKNKSALSIAKAFRDANNELVGMKNRYGAYIRQAPGWIIPQTHDTFRIRRAGHNGVLGWGKKSKETSFKAWVGSLQENGIEIDWDRTLDGQTQEQFLKNFHKNVFHKVFGGETDSYRPDKFKAHGTLAARLSSQRVLWFKDGASAFKYNQLWGRDTYNEMMRETLFNGARHVSLMQHFGPNHNDAFNKIVRKLKEKSRLGDDPVQTDKLGSKSLEQNFDVLNGNSSISERPTLSRFVDNLKAWILITKGGAITISSLTDKGFFQSAMAAHGIKAADRLMSQLEAFARRSPDLKRALESITYVSDSMMISNAGRYTNEFKPATWLRSAVDTQFKLTGLNRWTSLHEEQAGNILAFQLGTRDASLSWDKLDAVRKQDLERYGIDGDEWEALRKNRNKVYEDVSDNYHVITPEQAQTLTDDTVNAILSNKGLKPTAANRARFRDDLDAKLSSYFGDFIHEAVPRPGLREKAVMSRGLPRGDGLRELLEVFSVFKSFPITVLMQLKRRWGNKASKGEAMMMVFSLMAQTTILGLVANGIKDWLKGRTPKRLWDDERGQPNWDVFMAGAARGGGMGFLGDLLFSEYDNQMKSLPDFLAGPVVSELSSALSIVSGSRANLLGAEGPSGESLAYMTERLVERNIPFASMFYIRPALEYLLFYNIREALSPGVLRRMERSVRKDNDQDFWLSPVEMGSIPVRRPGEKVETAVEKIF